MNSQERNKLKSNKPFGNNLLGFRELEQGEIIALGDYYWDNYRWIKRGILGAPYDKNWHCKTIRRIDLTSGEN